MCALPTAWSGSCTAAFRGASSTGKAWLAHTAAAAGHLRPWDAFAAVPLHTTAAKRCKRVANATAVIWNGLTIAESQFGRLDLPLLLTEVAEGAFSKDGDRARSRESEAVV